MTKLVNKYVLIALALLFSASVFSQQSKNEFYISGSVGASKLLYSLNSGKKDFQLGGAFGFGYKQFFSEHVGISFGVEGALYAGAFKASNLNYHEKVFDHLFKNIDYTAVLSDYKEVHKVYTINFPILLHFQSSGKHKFYSALGGKVCLPVSFYSVQSPVDKVVATGYASEFNTYFDDLEIMGFGEFSRSETLKRNAKDIGLKTKVSGVFTAELGMKWSLSEKLYLYTAAFADYGITTISTAIDDAKNKDFLPYYAMSALDSKDENSPILINSVLNSRYDYKNNENLNFTKNNSIRPFIIGLKLALSFGFGDKYGQSTSKSSDIVEIVPRSEPIKEAEPVKEPEPEPVKELAPISTIEPISPIEEIKEPVIKPKPIPKIKDENLADLTEKEKAIRPDEGVALVIDNYKINSSSLSTYWIEMIDEHLLALKDKQNYHILLEGHTCSWGSDKTNDKLSLERANMVKQHMLDKGFAPERISTVGKGKHSPLLPNNSLENRKKNRRVVFIITDSSK